MVPICPRGRDSEAPADKHRRILKHVFCGMVYIIFQVLHAPHGIFETALTVVDPQLTINRLFSFPLSLKPCLNLFRQIRDGDGIGLSA